MKHVSSSSFSHLTHSGGTPRRLMPLPERPQPDTSREGTEEPPNQSPNAPIEIHNLSPGQLENILDQLILHLMKYPKKQVDEK